MKLFVVGATGRTGRQVTGQALARGHSVTAIVRNAGSFDPQDGLKIVAGDPLDVDQLASALVGHDVVVSCLGQRLAADASLLQDAAAAMTRAMTSMDVSRYLVVSQGLLFPSSSPIVALLRLVLARYVADTTAMEQLVRASEVEWMIVRPPRLLEGGASRGYRIKVGGLPVGRRAMHRADLAAFLLDEAERREHPREIVGVTSG
jgi:putative NADH-flavin reductase